jgi:tetratricopeptide (TPR) repeat protein
MGLMLVFDMMFYLSIPGVHDTNEKFYGLIGAAGVLKAFGYLDTTMWIMQELLKKSEDNGLKKQATACRINIAHLWTLQGKYQECDDALQRILQPTDSDEETASECYEKMGKNYEDQGDILKAQKCYQNVVAYRVQTYGRRDLKTLRAKVMWLGAMVKDGLPLCLGVHFRNTLHDLQTTVGKEDMLTLECARLYMSSLNFLGKLKEADDVGEHFCVKLPEDDSETQDGFGKSGISQHVCIICMEHEPAPMSTGCSCRGSMGLAHAECVAGSAKAQQQTKGWRAWTHCTICLKKYSGKIVKELCLMFTVSMILESASDWKLFVAADGIAKIFDNFSYHTMSALIYWQLIGIYASNDTAEALFYKEESLTRYLYIMKRQEKYDEAICGLQSLIKQCEIESAKQLFYMPISKLFWTVQNFAKAREYTELVLEYRKQKEGAETESTILVMDFLGKILFQLEEYEEAASMLRVTVRFLREKGGSQTVEAKKTVRLLCLCLRKMGRIGEAMAIVEQYQVDL